MSDTSCQTIIKYACPRCGNRTLEQKWKNEGYDTYWCSVCYTCWEIEPFKEYDPWEDDSSHTSENEEKDLSGYIKKNSISVGCGIGSEFSNASDWEGDFGELDEDEL